MDSNDIISILTAAYKDRVERKLFEDLRAGMNALFAADADSRRKKAAADIMQMARLKTALRKFELTYAKIKDDFGNVDAIDDYIAEVQKQIKTISYRKNHMNYQTLDAI